MIRTRLLTLVLAFATGCAWNQRSVQVYPVAIHVREDTVRLYRSPKGASLRASVAVHNRSQAILYLDTNCPRAALQRQIGSAWQTVWNNQICLLIQSSPKKLAPGDSATVFVAFRGSTGVSPELAGWPPVDRRVEPGVYRLVVALGSNVDEQASRITALFPADARSSEPFMVYAVERPR